MTWRSLPFSFMYVRPSPTFSATDFSILQAAGDQIETAVRSGVVADTSGSYILVVDSLPDTVYQYAGQGNGDFTVTFSRIGSGEGDYIFLGGDNYRFVGPGNGDLVDIDLALKDHSRSRERTHEVFDR